MIITEIISKVNHILNYIFVIRITILKLGWIWLFPTDEKIISRGIHKVNKKLSPMISGHYIFRNKIWRLADGQNPWPEPTRSTRSGFKWFWIVRVDQMDLIRYGSDCQYR